MLIRGLTFQQLDVEMAVGEVVAVKRELLDQVPRVLGAVEAEHLEHLASPGLQPQQLGSRDMGTVGALWCPATTKDGDILGEKAEGGPSAAGAPMLQALEGFPARRQELRIRSVPVQDGVQRDHLRGQGRLLDRRMRDPRAEAIHVVEDLFDGDLGDIRRQRLLERSRERRLPRRHVRGEAAGRDGQDVEAVLLILLCVNCSVVIEESVKVCASDKQRAMHATQRIGPRHRSIESRGVELLRKWTRGEAKQDTLRIRGRSAYHESKGQ